MVATKEELKAIFASKAKELVSELEAWFEEETESIDGSIAAAAPSGSGGSIMGTCPAIDSKRVVDVTVITKKVLDIELPPEIIQPGGYASCDEMIADLVPKLEQVFIGDIKVKKRSRSKSWSRREGFAMSDESEKWRAIGERLRKAREYLELKQEEAADAIGISRSALSLVENGRRKVDAVELGRFALVYGQSIGS